MKSGSNSEPFPKFMKHQNHTPVKYSIPLSMPAGTENAHTKSTMKHKTQYKTFILTCNDAVTAVCSCVVFVTDIEILGLIHQM